MPPPKRGIWVKLTMRSLTYRCEQVKIRRRNSGNHSRHRVNVHSLGHEAGHDVFVNYAGRWDFSEHNMHNEARTARDSQCFMDRIKRPAADLKPWGSSKTCNRDLTIKSRPGNPSDISEPMLMLSNKMTH